MIDGIIDKLVIIAAMSKASGERDGIISPAHVNDLIKFMGGIAHLLSDVQRDKLQRCIDLHPSIAKIADNGVFLRDGLARIQKLPDDPAQFFSTLKQVTDASVAIHVLVDKAGESPQRDDGGDAQQKLRDNLMSLLRWAVGTMSDTKAIAALYSRLQRPDYATCHGVLRDLDLAAAAFLAESMGPTARAKFSDALARWDDSYTLFRVVLAQYLGEKDLTHAAAKTERSKEDRRKYGRLAERAIRAAFGILISVTRDSVHVLGSTGTEYHVIAGNKVERARFIKSQFSPKQLEHVAAATVNAKLGELEQEAVLVFPNQLDSNRRPKSFIVADQWVRDLNRCTMSVGDIETRREDFRGDGLGVEKKNVGNIGGHVPADSTGLSNDADSAPEGRTRRILYSTVNTQLYALLEKLLTLCGGNRSRLLLATQQMNQAYQAGAEIAFREETFGTFGAGLARLLDDDLGTIALENEVSYSCIAGTDGDLHFSATMRIPKINAVIDLERVGGASPTWLNDEQSFIQFRTKWTVRKDDSAVLDPKEPCERTYVMVENSERA